MQLVFKMTILFVAAVATVVLIAGCAVGPDYKPPQTKMPESYGATTQPTELANLRQWWTTFNDATLNTLIDRATEANLDLRLAAARIRESRAARGVVRADYYPTLD